MASEKTWPLPPESRVRSRSKNAADRTVDPGRAWRADRNRKRERRRWGAAPLDRGTRRSWGSPGVGFLSSGVGGTSLRVSESMHDLPASFNLQPADNAHRFYRYDRPSMDLRQLAALVAVDDHGSFSAAARALYTVQSNVSAHIAHLERELGVTLVDRAKGRLTPGGRRGRGPGPADPARAGGPHGRRHLDGPGGRRRGPPRRDRHHGPLAGPAAARPPCTPPTRKVQVIILEASTTSLVPQLVTGELDLAVVNLPVDDPEIDTAPLFEEELVLLATRGEPAGRPRVGDLRRARRPPARPPAQAPRCARTWTPRPAAPA